MTIALSWSPLQPTVGQQTLFSISVDDLDGNVTHLEIRFGSGETGFVESTLCLAPVVPYHATWTFGHTYESSGSYDVRLIVESGPCMPILVEKREVTKSISVSRAENPAW
jgi:hypothetical protein